MNVRKALGSLLHFITGSLSPERSLLENWLFRLCLLSPIALAASFVLNDPELTSQLQGKTIAEALEYIWTNKKIILLSASVAFPLCALAASHLRSQQASKQISQQREQNVFSNHFKHLEEFEKSLSKQTELSHTISARSLSDLHSVLFPKSIEGDYSISPRVKIELRVIYLTINKVNQRILEGPICETTVESYKYILAETFKRILGTNVVKLERAEYLKYSNLLSLTSRASSIGMQLIDLASFYSRHTCRDLSEEIKESTSSLWKNLLSYSEQELEYLEALKHHLDGLKKDFPLEYTFQDITSVHNKIFMELTKRGVDKKYYYPFETILKKSPAGPSEVNNFLYENAPAEIKDRLAEKFSR